MDYLAENFHTSYYFYPQSPMRFFSLSYRMFNVLTVNLRRIETFYNSHITVEMLFSSKLA